MPDHTEPETTSQQPKKPPATSTRIAMAIGSLSDLRPRLLFIHDICTIDSEPDGTAVQDAIKWDRDVHKIIKYYSSSS